MKQVQIQPTSAGPSGYVAPEQVALISDGPEGYGISAIARLYAMGSPGMRFVCQSEGQLTDDLRGMGVSVLMARHRTVLNVGSSLKAPWVIARGLMAARRTARDIHKILRPLGVRIVHLPTLGQQILGVFLRGFGYKAVWQINNNMDRSRGLGLGQKINHWLARCGADVLLPASDFIAANWKDCGVCLRTVRNAAIPKFLKANRGPAGAIKCVIAGRLCWSKGHHNAVEAVLAARKRGHDVLLDICGGPLESNSYADGLRKMVRDSGQEGAIRLLGFRDDLRDHHQEYHLGLHCRIDPEPCSLWICETLVDGLPLVASASGGTPELVDNSKTGVLYEPGSTSDLTAKLLLLLENPGHLESMRNAAFDRGQSMFTLSRFISETFAVYGELLRSA